MNDAKSQLLSFACPKCQKKLRAPANLAGQKLACPKCSAPIRVPGLVETKNDDDDWLALSKPSEPAVTPEREKRQAVQPKELPTRKTPVPAMAKEPQSADSDPDELRLAPPESKVAKSSPKHSQAASNKPAITRSVFDDDLPELVPEEELKTAVAKVPATSKPKLELPDVQLPDLDPSIDELTLESPVLIGPMASLDDQEFSFPCKCCGSLLTSSRSRVGTQTTCPDCYSPLMVPNPLAKRKLSDVKMDVDVARVTFAPIDSLSANGTNSSSEKTKEILDKAEQSIEEEREEFLDGSFDTKRWMGFLFGFLRDPLVVAAAIGLGFVTGFWLFSMAAMGTWIKLEGVQVLIARIALLCVFCIPIVGTICMCGIAVLTMAANRTSRVREWPFLKLSDSIGECMMVVVSVLAASIPGGILGVVSSSLNAHPMISFAFILLGIWGLTPLLLLSMIDNGSIFEPYSKGVWSSITSRSEAWAAMYMQTAIAFVTFYLFLLLTSVQKPAGDFILGLALPLACFFLFGQYGVLAGRISQVTQMGFEGDFSED